MRTPLLITVVPMFVFFWAVVFTHKLDNWSVAATAVGAGAMVLLMSVRDYAPQHVLNWRRGAEGERRTEKALRPLERQGWTVEHDVQRERSANFDHVVRGPGGVFLLETKNLLGTITFEHGVLQARQFDDPDEVYKYTSLAARVRGQAAAVSERTRAETGRRPWVTGVVVIWGLFEQGVVEHEKVTYIGGDRLHEWLEWSARAGPKEFVDRSRSRLPCASAARGTRHFRVPEVTCGARLTAPAGEGSRTDR